ncbi:hypothetical protein AB0395_36670 [Streptosporangium sp. NPDC051023]|uniref:hypothetical protein n=1 Tax=Streptosporangium sp. NPDC051023 TaxID=3155410 RepID=UPI00344B6925
MIKVRNALVAGALGASALIVPVTMPAQLAGAATVAAPALTAPQPCRPGHKCHPRHGGGGGGLDDSLDDNRMPGSSGGAGIDN